MTKVFSERRLLLKCEGRSYKLLSFTQRNDGSIYIGFQNFRNIKWVAITLPPGGSNVSLIDSTEEEGKLTFHASGVVGFRSHNEPGDHQLRIRGNYLYDHRNAMAGVRHLVTTYMEKPDELPAIFPERLGDFWIQNSKPLMPFVLMLFAVPRAASIQYVDFEVGFQLDDLQSVPPEGGAGMIDLKYHSIFWYSYRTKFMDRWPKESYVCYHDGFMVPMYIGQNQGETSGEIRLEMNLPKYEVEGSDLKIILQ